MKLLMILIIPILTGILLLTQVSKAEAPQSVAKHQRLIDKLIACESQGNPLAYNPKDSDGKEKFGKLQFDEDTLKEFTIKYGLLSYKDFEESDWKNWLRDSNYQQKLADLMIQDGYGYRWGCWKHTK